MCLKNLDKMMHRPQIFQTNNTGEIHDARNLTNFISSIFSKLSNSDFNCHEPTVRWSAFD